MLLPWWQWPKEFKNKNNKFLKSWLKKKTKEILIKKLIQYYIDLIVSWYRKIKTYFNLNYEIKKYHDSFDKPKKPVIKEVGKFGDKDWSISIGDIDE